MNLQHEPEIEVELPPMSIAARIIVAGITSLGREYTAECYREIERNGKAWLPNTEEYQSILHFARRLAEYRGVL